MNNLWRKSFMAGILSVSLTAGAVTPAFASAAPDGKTDAASLAGGMGISRNWESWKAEWEAVKNDWTQVSLTPGSDFSQLNFAWYSKKDNSDCRNLISDCLCNPVHSYQICHPLIPRYDSIRIRLIKSGAKRLVGNCSP